MSDVYESPDPEGLQVLKKDAEKRAAREGLAAARKAARSAQLQCALYDLRECLGPGALVVGEDGRIGRLERVEQLQLQTNNLDMVHYGHPIEPVYRVCWET